MTSTTVVSLCDFHLYRIFLFLFLRYLPWRRHGIIVCMEMKGHFFDGLAGARLSLSAPLMRTTASAAVAIAVAAMASGNVQAAAQAPTACANRFYGTARDADGRWWFVAPDGKRFFLNGIGVVTHWGHFNASLGYSPYEQTVGKKYPSLEDWATNTLARLKSWGFNMLSSSSPVLLQRGMPHASVLAIGERFSMAGGECGILPWDGGPCTGFPNVFHPEWAEHCRRMAKQCAESKDDPWVLGWYIDNELSWWGDGLKFLAPPSRGLFDACAAKPPTHSARIALGSFLAERGIASPADATDDVAREFVRLVARRYFEDTTRAIREADPNHLVLGCRFAGLATSDPVVWEECGKYCDVVSANTYPVVDLDRGVALDGSDENARLVADEMAECARQAGKPLIITEWSFVALDSGLPCMHGAGQRFFTQRERAEAMAVFAKTLHALPECAGYVYFMWCDQPKVGSKDEQSEDSNYGLVDSDDNPWPEVTETLSKIQNDSRKWRYESPPPDRPVARPSARGVAKAAVLAGASAPCRFWRGDNGVFGLSNGFAKLEGRIGGDEVSINGLGALSTFIREYSSGSVDWSFAARVADVRGEVADGLGVMEVTFSGEAKSGVFDMMARVYLPQGRPFFIAELLGVANRGGQALPVDSVFFRLFPKGTADVKVARGDYGLEPPEDGQPTPIPPKLWRKWREAAWELEDGSFLGLATHLRTGVEIKFWKDLEKLHSDAYARVQRTDIAPGGSLDLARPPFVAGACCREGEDAWRGICSMFKTAFEAASLEGVGDNE